MASHHGAEGKNWTSQQRSSSSWSTGSQEWTWQPGQEHHWQWHDGQWHQWHSLDGQWFSRPWAPGQWRYESWHHELWHHEQWRDRWHVQGHPGKGHDPTQGHTSDAEDGNDSATDRSHPCHVADRDLCFLPDMDPRQVYEHYLAKRRGKSLQSSMQEQDEWIRKSNGAHYDKKTFITCPWPGPMKLTTPGGSSLREAMGWSDLMCMKMESKGRLWTKCSPAMPLESYYATEETLHIAPAGRYYRKLTNPGGPLKEYWFTIGINTNIPISAGPRPMDIKILMDQTILTCAAGPNNKNNQQWCLASCDSLIILLLSIVEKQMAFPYFFLIGRSTWHTRKTTDGT